MFPNSNGILGTIDELRDVETIIGGNLTIEFRLPENLVGKLAFGMVVGPFKPDADPNFEIATGPIRFNAREPISIGSGEVEVLVTLSKKSEERNVENFRSIQRRIKLEPADLESLPSSDGKTIKIELGSFESSLFDGHSTTNAPFRPFFAKAEPNLVSQGNIDFASKITGGTLPAKSDPRRAVQFDPPLPAGIDVETYAPGVADRSTSSTKWVKNASGIPIPAGWQSVFPPNDSGEEFTRVVKPSSQLLVGGWGAIAPGVYYGMARVPMTTTRLWPVDDSSLAR
ncbi:MAG: hypothetical protein ACK5PB_16715 [Pirellula sp.]